MCDERSEKSIGDSGSRSRIDWYMHRFGRPMKPPRTGSSGSGSGSGQGRTPWFARAAARACVASCAMQFLMVLRERRSATDLA